MIERLNEWGYALSQTLQGQLDAGSVSAIFVVFAAGVLTSFTPCVYPMIPVTVTYIGGAAAGNRRRAVALSTTYVLGLAMMDVFTIPALATGLQGKGARKGGYLGAAVMGVAAGFVAAPCTAPVLGLLLAYVGQTRNVVWGGSLLFVFALGLGLLLMLLGIFSGMLASLPKAGVWTVRVKKGFGIAMLVVGAYFLWMSASMLLAGGGRA